MKTKCMAVAVLALCAAPALPQGPPPVLPPARLDALVARIALYPDPLLAQVLAASTYPEQIPDAARWADEHHYVTGEALARAMEDDQLPWDPAVQALLPFPSVLAIMAADLNWTYSLGDAFLAQERDVMDAVQRQRRRAQQFGYLRTNPQVIVTGEPYIVIQPAHPVLIPVPYYDPAIVFYPPRRGVVVGTTIRFGYGVQIGIYFRTWGWGYGHFDWGSRVVIINKHPWRRTWENRRTYVHPYELRRPPGPRPQDRHRLEPRSRKEYEAPQRGKRIEEKEHRDQSKPSRQRRER